MTHILKKTECKGILVYLEFDDNNNIDDVCLELSVEANKLRISDDDLIFGVVVTADIDDVQEKLELLPFDYIYIYESKYKYNFELDIQAVIHCIQTIKPNIVLIGSTDKGKLIAPKVAVTFRTGLTADCTDFDYDENNNLIQIRPAFGGNIMASILTQDSRPQMATVRSHVFKKDFSNIEIRKPAIKMINNYPFNFKQDIQQKAEQKIVHGISNERILVAIGKGIRNKQDIHLFKQLANLLKGKIASSRGLVEKGWMSSEQQIGLSGNVVNAQCVITCGISGSVQFMAGLKNCKNIIAINNDKTARIFDFAHYPICGDLYEIIPNMITEIIKNNK